MEYTRNIFEEIAYTLTLFPATYCRLIGYAV